MAKSAAFGTSLEMGDGGLQLETADVVGTIINPGNATFTITAAGMVGSALAISVAVLAADTAAVVAGKARITIGATAAVTDMFHVCGAGATVVLIRKIATTDDATLNIAYTNGTCSGLTPDASSTHTIAGGGAETFTEIAQVTSIGGPALSLDVEDVSSLDQATAWEEVVPTILRTGEVSLDLVFDPLGATHSPANGMVAALENRQLKNFVMTFPDAVEWSFSGYVTGFEPSAPVDGALTAAAKIKLSGEPTLA